MTPTMLRALLLEAAGEPLNDHHPDAGKKV